MVNILHIVPDIDGGGVGAVVFNYLSNMDRKGFNIDVVARDYGYKQFMHDNFTACGINIFYVTQKNKKLLQHFKEIDEIMKKKHYDVVHCHDQNWSYFYLKLAKKNNVPVRIAHSHLTIQNNDRIKIAILNLFTPALKKIATGYFACGKEAGAYMWGWDLVNSGKVYIMKNAVNLDRFQFCENDRENIRNRMNWNDKFVIGHVGRFNEQKNHKYLIQVFRHFHDMYPNSLLALVGQGELEEDIRKSISDLQLENCVELLGVRGDVPELMSAFDLFLFPSLYEGLPVVGVEAQANGLSCIFSDTITQEVNLLDSTVFLSLEADIRDWVVAIENCVKRGSNNRELAHDRIREKGFDIKAESENLRKYYLNNLNTCLMRSQR